MRATFVTFLTLTLWAATFKGVVSLPLGAIIGDGSPGNRAKIQDALAIANKQIYNMQSVLYGPNPQAHPAVIRAFGANANIDAIRANVNVLATQKIKIPHADAAYGVTQGATRFVPGGRPEVTFGHVFYTSGAHDRAGTLIHESAHALLGAVDHFDPYGRPYPLGSQFNRAYAKVGYKDSHLPELRAIASHNMHYNADSYRVFGESCPEARELFERALEEEDSEHRSHLIRRAGAACTYHPRGKTGKAETRFARKAAKKAAKAEQFAKKQAKAAGAHPRPPSHATPKKAGRTAARKNK